MFHFRLSLLLLLTSCYSFTLGFFVPSTTVSSNTRLLVGLSFDDDITDDDAYFQLLKRATDCASEEEEECSLEESQFLLHQVESLSKLNVVSLTEMMENLRQKTSIADSRSLALPRLSSWLLPAFSPAKNEWTLFCSMLLVSTYATITAPSDEIVIRIGWALQDWSTIASTTTSNHAVHIPALIYAAALYVALSDVVSSLLPTTKD